MNQPSFVKSICWPAALVLMATNAFAATMGPNTVAEITFETTAPYYQPQLAVVSASTPVRWVNVTASAHSVRHDGCLNDEPCAFQSIAVPPDSSFIVAPLPPGRYSYHCELHPIMRGTLLVVELSPVDEAISLPESPR